MMSFDFDLYKGTIDKCINTNCIYKNVFDCCVCVNENHKM